MLKSILGAIVLFGVITIILNIDSEPSTYSTKPPHFYDKKSLVDEGSSVKALTPNEITKIDVQSSINSNGPFLNKYDFHETPIFIDNSEEIISSSMMNDSDFIALMQSQVASLSSEGVSETEYRYEPVTNITESANLNLENPSVQMPNSEMNILLENSILLQKVSPPFGETSEKNEILIHELLK